MVAYCKGIKLSRLKNATKLFHPIVSCTALLYALTVTICLSKSGKEGRIDIHSHKYKYEIRGSKTGVGEFLCDF